MKDGGWDNNQIVDGLYNLGLVLVPKKFVKFFRFLITSNLAAHAWSIKYK